MSINSRVANVGDSKAGIRHTEHRENSAMSRFQILRRLHPSAVVPAALVGVLAVTGVSGLAEAPPSSLGGAVQLVDENVPTDGMSYDMTSTNRSEVGRRYDAIIRDIRGRVRATPLYGGITLTRNQDDYFPVTLSMGRSQITLVFNARNLYIVGWRNDGTDRYYRLGAGPKSFAGARTTNLNWLNYNDMEGAANIDRGSLAISMDSIQGSISDLGNLHYTAAGRNQARALLILTQAFAEGARFDYFSYRISEGIRSATSYFAGTSSTISSTGSGSNSGRDLIGVTGLQLENSWGALSRATQNATHNHAAPRFHIGNGDLTTLAAIDAQLAIALWHKL
ncbi:ribosome-inactivating family protein [Streptomyces adonidis]|uniref:ribosome-inactivating family protein n=1 Tax=Streptomyces adonidis TaxID=3231367 RepID=UPI0034DB5FA7